MKTFLRYYLSCCALLIAAGAVAETTTFIYPRSISSVDSQYMYDYDLLRLALEKTRAEFGHYELRHSDVGMAQARAAEEIYAGTGTVNIFARSTSVEHEARMLPIRIPLDKGLISYRIFLIREEDQRRFSSIRTLDDLRELSVGSYTTWADTKILRDNGFSVVTGESYEGLFKMLIANRFDFFSRSVDEAYREYDERSEQLPTMKVEDAVLLHFPTTRYFFVQRSPAGEKLARRVEHGLNQMIKDGSFDILFRKYKGPLIDRAHLKTRRMFRIPNPHLPPETPLARRELWYDPLADR
ncbi:MAG: hypothetical protein ACREX0_01085 [Noviherbaspirillum sp.]